MEKLLTTQELLALEFFLGAAEEATPLFRLLPLPARWLSERLAELGCFFVATVWVPPLRRFPAQERRRT